MILETVWFFLWGLLWAMFFMTEGFDFGTGMLMPFLGHNEAEKRLIVNSIGPVWDGNEVWLVTAGGVTFAAFPRVYAVMFSSLYTPLMLILFALILRGVAFEFRAQVDSIGWRRVWDACIFVGSAAPALLFGVAFANIFMGIPVDGHGIYHGSLLGLLTSYGLIGGSLFVLLFLLHGALWLTIKTSGDLQQRAATVASRTWVVVALTAVLFLGTSIFATNLYANYLSQPLLFLVPIGAVAALMATRRFLDEARYLAAWLSSAGTIALCTFFGIVGLYPNLFPSSLSPEFHLTAHNSASSPYTLKIMLVVVLIFVPIVLAYQFWVYRLFHGEVEESDLVY